MFFQQIELRTSKKYSTFSAFRLEGFRQNIRIKFIYFETGTKNWKKSPISYDVKCQVISGEIKDFSNFVASSKYMNLHNIWLSYHTACISFWIPKRQAISTEGVFSWYLTRKRKFYGWKWRAALTGHGQSSQSANFWKIAKMALFNPCMKLEIFGAKWLHLKCLRIVLSELYWVYS